jgi:peptidylprolyl isomerase
MEKVKDGDFVQVRYTGTLEDDSVFDSSDGRGPLEFQVGSPSIIPGFNQAVLGMALNEEKTITVTPDEGYGHLQEEAKREFPKEMLGEMQIEVGQELRFSSPRGPIAGRVLAIEPDKFVVDFNHPLAGKTLGFQIKVVGISDTPTQTGCSCGCSPSDCGTTC